MKAQESRAEYQVERKHNPQLLTKDDVIRAIERGLHTNGEVMDENLVKRKQEFFEGIFCDESMVKAFILLVP